VTLSNVQVVTNKRHQVTEILVGFSGALNAAEASDLGLYHLVQAGSRGSFTARNAKTIRLEAATYNAAIDTVVLVPGELFTLAKRVQLQVDGVPPSGLEDSSGRFIDGDRSGQPGSNAVAILSRGGVSMAALAVGPAGGANGVSAATVDALLELNVLAGVTTAQRSGRTRR
jgi:hypothetical protein